MHLLFVCTGNTCRSPMAAFFAKNEIAQRNLPWTADSAGLYAGHGMPMSSMAADALIRRHVPYESHASKPVSNDLVAQAAVILVMTSGHAADLAARFPGSKEKTRLLGQYLSEPPASSAKCDIVDPFGGSDDEYEACAAQLQTAVQRLIQQLADAEAGDESDESRDCE